MIEDEPPLPPLDVERFQAVKAALQARDTATAIAVARAMLDLGQRHPLLLNLRALWLEQQGRDEDALADLTLAVSLAPRDPGLHNAHGLALERLGRLEEAVAAFRVATELSPDFGAAFFNLGRSLDAAGMLVKAEQAFERAAALSPQNPHPLAFLAMIAARRGNWPRLRQYAERALALDPGHVLARRAMLTADMATDDPAAAETRIASLLADQRLGAFDRYHVLGTLGDLRHAQHRYPEAFEAYAEGARFAEASEARRFDGPRSALRAAQWTVAYFERSPAWPRAASLSPPASARPSSHVFLMGFARSGTTLLEQVLASHPRVVALEERETLTESAFRFMTGTRGLEALRRIDPGEREELVAAYWARIRDEGLELEQMVFIDKMPFNALKLPIIATLFPEAKILFALRDPRDVILSCFRQRFRIAPYTVELLNLERGAAFYDAYMRATTLCLEKLPLSVHFTRHEDLLDDFDSRTREICDFIDVAWTEDMRDFNRRVQSQAHVIATPSALQVARGLNRSGVGTWRHYRDQMQGAAAILRPWIERYGYPAD